MARGRVVRLSVALRLPISGMEVWGMEDSDIEGRRGIRVKEFER